MTKDEELKYRFFTDKNIFEILANEIKILAKFHLTF